MNRFALFLSGAFCLIGVVMTVLAARHFARRRAFLRRAVTADGEIVGNALEREEIEEYYFPRIRFRTQAGRDVVFQGGEGRRYKPWPLGSSVPVWYRPERPEEAEVGTTSALWMPTIIFALLAAAFLAAGVGTAIGLVIGDW